MIKDGVLENPRVQKIIGLHVEEKLEVGKIMIKNGMVNAASNPYKIKVKGHGGHGARPNTTVDPIVIGANIVSTLQTIMSERIISIKSWSYNSWKFPLWYSSKYYSRRSTNRRNYRTTTPEDRKYVTERVAQIAEGIAKASRGEVEVLIEESYPCTTNK